MIRGALRAAGVLAVALALAELADQVEQLHDRAQGLAARIRDLETSTGRRLDAARADALCDQDRAMGESALLAEPGTGARAAAIARVKQWRAMHPGFSALIDYQVGGSG